MELNHFRCGKGWKILDFWEFVLSEIHEGDEKKMGKKKPSGILGKFLRKFVGKSTEEKKRGFPAAPGISESEEIPQNPKKTWEF